MAKFVVAGRSDCPYFAKAELLGDRLAKNLKKFKLHKIMIQPDKWDQWLKNTCQEKGWKFSKSPIVWRELIDRGGKGVLIGGANEFQEYVKAYYDLESDMNSYDMRTISGENKITKDEIDTEEAAFKALSHPVHVCITDAGNPVCYHLLNTITSGQVLGPGIELTVRLLVSSKDDIDAVTGMAWEAEDLAHGLLKGVKVCTSAHEAFQDCSVVILLDSIVKDHDISTRDWLIKNEAVFSRYAHIINDKALKTCKVMVCGQGPLNFNARVISQNAPGLSRKNIVSVSAVLENHAKSVIGERLHVNPAGVVSLIVWGNVNGKHHLDVSKCRVHNYDGAIWGPNWYSVSAMEMIHDNKWIQKELPGLAQGRSNKIAEAMGRPTTLSTANAISTTLQYWCRGSPHKQVFSLGVHSEGWYGVPEGLFFSFPVTMDPKGYWHVVQDIALTFESKQSILTAVEDLEQELSGVVADPESGKEESDNTHADAENISGNNNNNNNTNEVETSTAVPEVQNAEPVVAEEDKPGSAKEEEKPAVEAEDPANVQAETQDDAAAEGDVAVAKDGDDGVEAGDAAPQESVPGESAYPE